MAATFTTTRSSLVLISDPLMVKKAFLREPLGKSPSQRLPNQAFSYMLFSFSWGVSELSAR